jgi:glutaredoxin
MKVKLYTTPTCTKCKILKSIFTSRGVEIEEIQDMAILKAKGIMSVPIVELEDGRLLEFEEATKLTK